MKVKEFSHDTALYKAKSREIKRSVKKDKKQLSKKHAKKWKTITINMKTDSSFKK